MSRQLRGPVRSLGRETAIYLAGLFDGEGSWMVWASAGKSGMKYNASVRIGMSHKPTIEWVGERLGRKVETHGLGKNVNPNAKPMWRVEVRDLEGIISFTEQLLPFLKTKRDVAEVVLAFCRSRRTNGYRGGALRSYSGSDVALVKDAKSLNHFGRKVV